MEEDRHSEELRILSANVRGLRTNLGDLTNTTLRNNADIVICCETFLDDSIPPTYGQMQGYTHWYRRDRSGQGGGVAVCHKLGLHIQALNIDMPAHYEIIFLKIYVNQTDSILLTACYRPQWQGSAPLEYLRDNLDRLLVENGCSNLLIVGDLNQNIVQRSFNELLLIHDLHNHVDFPTHVSGSSLDPVISDFPNLLSSCEPLSNIGSSDHNAILTCFNLSLAEENINQRTIWLWKESDWEGLREELRVTDWQQVLRGPIDLQVQRVTKILLEVQQRHVPSRNFSVRSKDQPWFGYRCRLAADEKYQKWNNYKRNPTHQNKEQHRLACRHLVNTVVWAKRCWQNDIRHKLHTGRLGTKQWWSTVKEQQGLARDDIIPPLTRVDGTAAFSSKDKAEELARHFSDKMRVAQPHKPPPQLIYRTQASLSTTIIHESRVRNLLSSLDTSKAVGPDGISPHLLRQCCMELAPVYATLFNSCLQQHYWPKLWKIARVVPVHKKGGKNSVKNYRPVSLLPIPSKVFEDFLVTSIKGHLEQHHLLSPKQFGFLEGKSASDLLLLLVSKWQQSLDASEETRVVALDIAGAFDTVWHNGLLARLRSLGIKGKLLGLLESYLSDRSLRVVLQGEESSCYPIAAGVPQGSLLGPLLWNIFFDEILLLSPSATAYADDLTLSKQYTREERGEATLQLQQEIEDIASWGQTWQVKFAADKSQTLTISRMADRNSSIALSMNGNVMEEKVHLSILGVTFDSTLRFKKHIQNIARVATMKLSHLRRIAHLLTAESIQQLYKSQIRSSLEYAMLAWSGAARTHLALLDRIQDRAERLANTRAVTGEVPAIDALQHRREVGGLTVMYKAYTMEVEHLAPLRQPLQTSVYPTRAATTAGRRSVVIPHPHSTQFQRAFIYKFSLLWNNVCPNLDSDSFSSVNLFKARVNTHLTNR